MGEVIEFRTKRLTGFMPEQPDPLGDFYESTLGMQKGSYRGSVNGIPVFEIDKIGPDDTAPSEYQATNEDSA